MSHHVVKHLYRIGIDGSSVRMNDDADTQRHYSLYAYDYINDNGTQRMSMLSFSFIENSHLDYDSLNTCAALHRLITSSHLPPLRYR